MWRGSAPGDRASTIVGENTELRIPWHTFLVSCATDGIWIAAMTIGLWAIMAAVWGWTESDAGWFRATILGMAGAWRIIRWGLVVPFLYWIYRIAHHRELLVVQRLEIEQKDPYYNGPYEMRTNEMRGRTWQDDYDNQTRLIDASLNEKPEMPTSLLPPVLVEADRPNLPPKDMGRPPVPAGGDRVFNQLLRRVMGNVHPFSRRAVTANGFYTRGEWEAIEKWCIEAGFHIKGSGEFTPKGKRWATKMINITGYNQEETK